MRVIMCMPTPRACVCILHHPTYEPIYPNPLPPRSLSPSLPLSSSSSSSSLSQQACYDLLNFNDPSANGGTWQGVGAGRAGGASDAHGGFGGGGGGGIGIREDKDGGIAVRGLTRRPTVHLEAALASFFEGETSRAIAEHQVGGAGRAGRAGRVCVLCVCGWWEERDEPVVCVCVCVKCVGRKRQAHAVWVIVYVCFIDSSRPSSWLCVLLHVQ